MPDNNANANKAPPDAFPPKEPERVDDSVLVDFTSGKLTTDEVSGTRVAVGTLIKFEPNTRSGRVWEVLAIEPPYENAAQFKIRSVGRWL